MRVRCGGVEGNDIEGVVIGGEFYDADIGHCDLEDTFTVRCDGGMIFEVHGWMVDVLVMEDSRPLVM